MRIGIGYDAHRLAEGRKLILGGVEVPFSKGLLGHSDADVLTHAICDAMLGAVGAGDIGTHFPPTEPQLEGISSLTLLRRVNEMLQQRSYRLENVDAVIVAQEPRLAPHIEAIRSSLAAVLQLSTEQVSVKATTTEAMGFEGRGEGIAAFATCLVEPLTSK